MISYCLQVQPESLSELKYIQTVPDLSTLPAKSDNLVTSTSTVNSLSPAMSHASRRRHDSDNDPPAE